MPTRIILRFSLNNDTSSYIRNHLEKAILTPGGISNTATGTWEGAATPAAMQAVSQAISLLANPTQVPKSNPAAAVDHVWFYLD